METEGGIAVTPKKTAPNAVNSQNVTSEVTVKLSEPTNCPKFGLSVRFLLGRGRVPGHPFDVSIDTGADMTVVSRHFVQNTLDESWDNWPQFSGVKAADGKMITTWGPIELRVELGGQEVKTSACAADVTEPVILGLPALKSLGAMVNLASFELWVGNCRMLFHREWKMGLP